MNGKALLRLTEEKLVKHPYNIAGGPAAKLGKAIEKLKGPAGKLSLRIEIVFFLFVTCFGQYFSWLAEKPPSMSWSPVKREIQQLREDNRKGLQQLGEKHEKALQQLNDKLKNLALNNRKVITQISPFRCIVNTKHIHRAL